MQPIRSVSELDDVLSRPDEQVLASLQNSSGDYLLLGAGGKMGHTLGRMLRRGLDQLGQSHRRVIAVSRFGSTEREQELQQAGLETLRCDLLDRAAVAALPDVANVFFMAGQKFGTTGQPEMTWAMNALVPALVAERFRSSRIVVFSTGNVYPLSAVDGPGAAENSPLTPPGEYANSCVARERLFAWHSLQHGTPMLMFRLCYAIDLRYGVLLDLAQKIAAGQAIDLSMGRVQVIWQGDACARAICCLDQASSPPTALNVTGNEKIPVRRLAEQLAEALQCPLHTTGTEQPTAWVWDASRSEQLFGPPLVSLQEMIAAIAAWVRAGGPTLNKPTRFEVRDGHY
jgi:nucleoside-diphosphate-sugar epimerase